MFICLAWVQDVIAHWNFLTTPEQRSQRHVWVALRHEIDYLAEAVPGDAVLYTDGNGAGPALSAPYEEIIPGSDGKVLAQAVTQWCPLDRASGDRAGCFTEIDATGRQMAAESRRTAVAMSRQRMQKENDGLGGLDGEVAHEP